MDGIHRPQTTDQRPQTTDPVTSLRRLLTRLGCVSGVFWSLSPSVEAQGCAMCRTSAAAAAQAASAFQALNIGIGVLLIPPIILMSAILYMTFRQDE